MTEYAVSLGALHSEDLADGRTVVPGQQVKGVDPEKDKRLIDEGILIELPEKKSTAKAADKKKEESND